ncbi:MAG: class I SAM-dependent DNA methyltransferase [Gemmataceae bacterium]|nr:class I SAM-dependent DNA methyltransferase [Gemmataceae bacterium]
MPADAKPLFRSDALRPKLSAFTPSAAVAAARTKLGHWTDLLSSKAAEKMKETELLADFLRDIFGDLLGYTGPASGAATYTLKRESLVQVDGKFADAALGRFTLADASSDFVVVIEGKGPRDPLDRPFGSRKRSAVEQALQYAVNLRIDWFLVTNMREIRLLHKGHDLFSYERFETRTLADDDAALKRFVYLLGAERVVPTTAGTHLDTLLADSRRIGRELTNDYYHEYATLRRQTFHELRRANPTIPPADLLAATQKILDRILFIAFCEDRGLLPASSIADTYGHKDPYNPRPIWTNFRGLFRAVDEGNLALNIAKYNGGLFAGNDFIDSLNVPDLVCKGFDKLAAYEYGNDSADPAAKLIDVEILGHIFEQSISDLEEMHQQIIAPPEAEPIKAGPSKRKKEGAFYTPTFVTRYIVAETLQPIIASRFEAFRQEREADAKGAIKKLLADPRAYDLRDLTKPQRAAIADFWQAWIDELATIRVVDPACGSGAFLLEAFDQLHVHYQQAQARYAELTDTHLFRDVDRQILQSNLFGMDLNTEAIEICRLSLWIKTAEQGKILTSLDDNVKQGNSVIGEPTPLDAWKQRFPAAFTAGGFDVVIGNPPYVRQEWIAKDKPFLQRHYKAYDGVADLYVYFYELGMKLLKPGGRLGFVVTNKWMRAGYGEALRKFFGDSAWVEQVVDFGHAKQIFPDADVFPSILIARKPANVPTPPSVRVCAIPREQLRIDDLSRQIKSDGYEVPRDRLGAEPWSLEPPGVAKLIQKIHAIGIPLNRYAGAEPLSGIKTGFNDAFLLDTPTKEKLLSADPKSADLLRPYVRGQDIERWQADWIGLWMIVMKSSGNYNWPWSKSGQDAEKVFASTYPAIHDQLNQYRDTLMKRGDQGEHWWELRSCAYWDAFDKPKIIYPEITWRAQWSFDARQLYINNTVYILPSQDLWILAVMNSPLIWWYSWRAAIHGKDEALRFIRAYVQEVPICRPTEVQH